MSTHNCVNTHRHTQGDTHPEAPTPSPSSRHTPPQQGSYHGTLSVTVGVAPGSRYTEICDRQQDRHKRASQGIIQATDTLSYVLRLTIVSLMENIVQIYKGQGLKNALLSH